MTLSKTHLTEQAAGGQSIDISSAADVHIVPDGQEHEVTVLANATAAEDITIKIDGEATGVVEALTEKKTRVIWQGIVKGNASTSPINCASSGSTARAWGVYTRLV